MKTLILAVGNLLLRDEGVGIHVLRVLEAETLPPDVHLLDGGTGGLHLLYWLEGYERIILVDATLDDRPPGTVRRLHPRYASDYPTLMSAHEIGLRDMIEAMMLTEHVPDVELVVISVENISATGLRLSPAVEAAIPAACRLIRHILSESDNY